MTPKAKRSLWCLVIAVVAFFAGWVAQGTNVTRSDLHSSQSFEFQNYELVLRYFTEWQGFRFLETNSSSLELIDGGSHTIIFETQRGFQESHRQVDAVELSGDTISWNDGVDSYRLTISPLSQKK